MIIHSEPEMLDFGARLAEILLATTTFPAIELIGDVGAGKTTFTRGLALGLGITEPVTSPSFTISKRYPFALPKNRCNSDNTQNTKCCKKHNTPAQLIHYDFYRLPDPGLMRDELAEALELPHSLIVIEWAGTVADILPDGYLRLTFNLLPDASREILISDQALAAKLAQPGGLS